MNQSDVSAVIRGGRQVKNVDVLVRLADGLQIPRGWLGLAHADGGAADLSRQLLGTVSSLMSQVTLLLTAIGIATDQGQPCSRS